MTHQDKSRAAFEAHIKRMIKVDLNYSTLELDSAWQDWQAAKAYGRKQALEEAIEICKKSQAKYKSGVSLVQSKLEELLNEQ